MGDGRMRNEEKRGKKLGNYSNYSRMGKSLREGFTIEKFTIEL